MDKKNILIVDDILTTGATIKTIAKLLVNNGSGKIYLTTFTTRIGKKYNDIEEE
ncbi:MAG: hypothetical protein LBD41_04700 [Clostridiales Family XIII bacterium]|nr:hypothetical protein [Clostridiales Family XIII bacterium]